VTSAEAQVSSADGLAREREETPWRRGLRRLLSKRIAVIAIILITIIYAAGTYTFLDAVGLPTGLQDPQATNLTVRRPIRATDGEAETLGEFGRRTDTLLSTLQDLNPTLTAEFGPLTENTVLPERTQLVLAEDEALEGPSIDHIFGTDRLGRDMFSRTLFSARTTLIITILSFVFGNIFLGLGLGLLAGYVGGLVDSIIMRVGDVLLAMPGLVILIVVNAVFKERWTSIWADVGDFFGTSFFLDQGIDDFSLIFFVLSIFGWVPTARFVRAQTLALRETDFILAAESVGAGTARIIVRHLLPGVLPWIVLGMSAALGAVAGIEVALTFLGIGVQPPTASFGAMIADAGGVRTLDQHPHLLLVPAVTIAVLIFSFNLLGDAVNDVVNPRGR
jgi:ABC-type dipeptide/oligopeptide/nickel transport system permease subunit